jgi:hypothetical protein
MNITFVPTHSTGLACPLANFLFSQLKIEMKGRHFDTVDVIKADSQAVLYTLTEHDF